MDVKKKRKRCTSLDTTGGKCVRSAGHKGACSWTSHWDGTPYGQSEPYRDDLHHLWRLICPT